MSNHRGVFVEKRTRQPDGSITPATGIGALYLPHGRYDMTVEGPDGFTGSVEWDGGTPAIVPDKDGQLVVTVTDIQSDYKTILTGTAAEVNAALKQLTLPTVTGLKVEAGATMARDFIAIDKTKTRGLELVNLIARLRVTANELEHLRDVMNHNTDAGNWADAETLFGITTGSGEVVYNMLSTTIAQLANADVQTLFDRVGIQ